MKPETQRGIEARTLADGTVAYRVHYRAVVAGVRKKVSRQFGALQEALDFRERFQTADVSKRPIRFRELVSRWLPVAERNHKAETLRVERSELDFYLLPAFGSQYVDKLTPSDWTNFLLNARGRKGQPISDKTAQNLFGLLHTILEWAVVQRLIADNPLAKSRGARHNPLRP